MLMRYYYTKLSYYLQKDIMSSNKGPFHNEYSVVEIIKSRKGKKTCIVHNSIGQYYIAKKFQMNDMYALNQIGLMKTIRHPNVVGFHDIVMEKGHAYLIEEYCQEGDLGFHIRRQVRKKRSYFSERTIAKWLLQLLLALEYLHNKKIMHRDIRPQNIFLTSLGNLKLGCFRSSKMFDNQSSLSSTILTSPYYMAPECIQSHGYDQKVDIWAFGSLLYQICSLKAAFSDKNIASQANMILKGQNKQLPSVYSKQLCQIYNKCLIKKSKDRPSAKALLRQNYFLEQMKKFVTEKPQTSIRIPIKHYNVHFNILANKKKQKDPKSLRQTIKASKKFRENEKERQPKVYTPVLPKIEQAHKIERRNSKSVQKYRNRQEPRGPTFVQIQKQKSIDKGRQKQRQSSKQMVRDKSRQLLTRKKSTNKIEKFIVNSPNNPSKKQKDVQRKQSADGKKTDRTITITQQYLQSPKKSLMAPPILPRPGKQKEKKEGQKISQSKEQMNFSQTKKKEGLAYQLSLIQKENAKMFDKQEIQSSLTKIFEDLNIKQQEQEQFSFELEDQSLARLTLKKNQGSELIQTYKTKLHQLIQEINYKYCPNMEPIQQRTQEFDSNTFANLKRN